MQHHLQYTLHPWHGVSAGENAPHILTAFIEIVPTDTVKYEIDKKSGWLKVDRPQLYSNIVPALYGFIPQTLCDESVAAYCMRQSGRANIRGDQDPMDILVLSEKVFPNSGFLLQAVPVGGFRMIDKGEADDKIIAVMKEDAVYGRYTDLKQLPEEIVNRLRHYFLTYKDMPGQQKQVVEIDAVYGAAEAAEIVQRSMNDYKKRFNEAK